MDRPKAPRIGHYREYPPGDSWCVNMQGKDRGKFLPPSQKALRALLLRLTTDEWNQTWFFRCATSADCRPQLTGKRSRTSQ